MTGVPGFSGAASLGPSRSYAGVANVTSGGGSAVVPQDFAVCTTNRSCWGLVLGCRDHCERYDGSPFSSLWYVCGGCIGLFQEMIEISF